MLDEHFKEIEQKIKSSFSFVDDDFLRILRRNYMNSLNLNFQGLRKLESYLSDIRQIKIYHANASYDYKDPKNIK